MRDGVWTVLDQGLFAGSNFAVNVLLARWLMPEAYGAFAVAFMVFLAVGVVHTGLFVEPMLVFGADRFRDRVGEYLRVLLAGHVTFSLGMGALMALGGLGVYTMGGSPDLGAALLAFGVGQSVILAMWLLRRACYVVARPVWAVSAGALYLAVVVGGAFVLYGIGALSAMAGVGLMVAGSAVAVAFLWYRLGVPLRRTTGAALPASVRASHSDYGRWSASTGILEWAHGAIPFLALPVLVGLEASGQLRALYNIAMPGLHAFSALTLMAVPVLVRARAAGRLRMTTLNVGAGLMVLSLLFAIVVLMLGRPAVEWLYKGQYQVSTVALLLLAIVPIPSALSGLLMAVHRSEEHPEIVFRARAAATGTAATVGLWLTSAFGVAGALASDTFALIVEGVVLARALFSRRARAARAEAASPEAESSEAVSLEFGSPDGSRLRVLLGAFACIPGEGSEPGIGWSTACETARHHDVWVLTYTGFRTRIEAALARNPVPGLHFVYHRLPFEAPQFAVEGQFRTGIAEQLHYYLWQQTAARVARRLHARVGFDLAHHVTFGKYWMPSGVSRLGVPFVWGPVGGGESAPHPFYAALTPASRRYERQRDLGRWVFERTRGVRRTARAAALAFATTEESAQRMEAVGARSVRVRSAIGLAEDVIDRLAEVPPIMPGPARFLMIGRQIPFKGHPFGIEAFARAIQEGGTGMADAELWLLGDGPERPALEDLASRLGVGDQVRFLGVLPRAEVLDRLGDSIALLHPSLHDSGGFVCIEAMAAGRPVVGFDLGGTRVQVPRDTGFLVEAEAPEPAVAALADAIRQVAANPHLAREKGEAGRQFVSDHYVWSTKVAEMVALYEGLVGRAAPPASDVEAVRDGVLAEDVL